MNDGANNNVNPKKKSFIKSLENAYIPKKGDKPGDVIVKIIFTLCTIAMIVSAVYIANYYLGQSKQEDILDEARERWEDISQPEPTTSSEDSQSTGLSDAEAGVMTDFYAENSDYIAWLRVNNARVNNPVYKTNNNDYYLDHNQQRKKSVYGALYFDYRNEITEKGTSKNLIIFGHEMRNGSMFGSLKKYRKVDFYKENPIVNLTTFYDKYDYKIFAVFVLNANPKDDNGYIYDIYRNSFQNENAFNTWIDEAYERSLINTGVDVNYNDYILTLVTCCNDFDNARLIIMSRRLRAGEDISIDKSKVSVNNVARYPKVWYDKHNYTYPY